MATFDLPPVNATTTTGTGNDDLFRINLPVTFGAGDVIDGGAGTDTVAILTTDPTSIRVTNVETVGGKAGGGNDTVTFVGDQLVVNVNLRDGNDTVNTTGKGTYIVSNVETVNGKEGVFEFVRLATSGPVTLNEIGLVGGSTGDDTINYYHKAAHGAGEVVIGNGGKDTVNLTGYSDGILRVSGISTVNGFSGVDKTGTLGKDQIAVSNAGAVTFNNVEVIIGSAGNDKFTVNTSTGATVNAGAGNDFVVGSQGTDNIIGGDGNDTLNGGGKGADKLDGGAGDDIVAYHKDNVLTAGGSGVDELRLSTGLSGITVNLGVANQVQGASGTVTGFENVNAAFVTPVSGKGVTIFGDNLIGGNILTGSDGNDVIDGKGGTDQIIAGQGDDSVTYDANDSLIDGDSEQAIKLGKAGFDTLVVEGTTTINFDLSVGANVDQTTGDLAQVYNFDAINAKNTSGDVNVIGNNGANEIFTGSGNDTVSGGEGDDVINGGNAGLDVLAGDGGNDVIFLHSKTSNASGGGDGATALLSTTKYNARGHSGDTVVLGVGNTLGTINLNNSPHTGLLAATTLNGFESIDGRNAPGSLTLTGNGLSNNLIGGQIDDTINGGAGEDVIEGHTGNDELNGGTGNDWIFGGGDPNAKFVLTSATSGSGNDIINGNAGDDKLFGQDGDDIIDGGADNDYIEGGTGNDILNGGTGNDEIYGGEGTDTINGGSGADKLRGDGGNDTINGGTDNDDIDGGEGDDILNGDAGIDLIAGGEGDDIITGGADLDILKGEGGDDTFVVASFGDYSVAGVGESIDGGAGGFDTLRFDGVVAGLNLTGSVASNISSVERLLLSNNSANAVVVTDDFFTQNGDVPNFRIDDGVRTAGALTVSAGTLTGSNALTVLANTGPGINDNITTGLGADTVVFSGTTGLQITDLLSLGADTGDVVQLVVDAGVAATLGGLVSGVDEVRIVDQNVLVSGKNAGYGDPDSDALGNATVTFDATFAQSAITVDGKSLDLGQSLTVDGSQLVPTVLTAEGGEGDDFLTGGAKGDTLTGNGGNDTITGGAGQDILNGGADNDTFRVGLVSDLLGTGPLGDEDVVNGGDDFDTIEFLNSSTSVDVTGVTSITNVERVLFSGTGNNSLTLNNVFYAANGLPSTERLIIEDNALAANLTVSGATLGSGQGIEVISHGGGTANLTGGGGNDVFHFVGNTLDKNDVVDGNGTTGVGGENAIQLDEASSNEVGNISDIQTIKVLSNNLSPTTTTTILFDTSYAQTSPMLYVDGSALGEDENLNVDASKNDNDEGVKIQGGLGDDQLIGSDDTDLIYGGGGNDVITGGPGGDKLYGEAGDDTFLVNNALHLVFNSEVIDGGTGTDKVVYTSAVTTDVVVPFGGLNNFVDIEELWFEQTNKSNTVNLDDSFYAANFASVSGEKFFAIYDRTVSGGNLKVNAGGLSDGNNLRVSIVESGSEFVQTGAGDDVLSTRDGAYGALDTFHAGAGYDVIEVRHGGVDAGASGSSVGIAGGNTTGVEAIVVLDPGTNGTDGNVTITVQDLDQALLTVDASALDAGESLIFSAVDTVGLLNTGSFNVTGGDGADTITGGDFDDILIGGAGNNTLNGGGGNDTLTGGNDGNTLIGGLGNDTITGGTGADFVTGGQGTDVINLGIDLVLDKVIFTGANDGSITGVGTGGDIVTGFVSGIDKIQIAGDLNDSTKSSNLNDDLPLNAVITWADNVGMNFDTTHEAARRTGFGGTFDDLNAVAAFFNALGVVASTGENALLVAVNASGQSAVYYYQESSTQNQISGLELAVLGTFDAGLVTTDFIL